MNHGNASSMIPPYKRKDAVGTAIRFMKILFKLMEWK